VTVKAGRRFKGGAAKPQRTAEVRPRRGARVQCT
jgi:hypothetical protein